MIGMGEYVSILCMLMLCVAWNVNYPKWAEIMYLTWCEIWKWKIQTNERTLISSISNGEWGNFLRFLFWHFLKKTVWISIFLMMDDESCVLWFPSQLGFEFISYKLLYEIVCFCRVFTYISNCRLRSNLMVDDYSSLLSASESSISIKLEFVLTQAKCVEDNMSFAFIIENHWL